MPLSLTEYEHFKHKYFYLLQILTYICKTSYYYFTEGKILSFSLYASYTIHFVFQIMQNSKSFKSFPKGTPLICYSSTEFIFGSFIFNL